MKRGMQGSIRRQPTTRLTFAGLRRFPRRELALEVLIQDEEGWEVPVESLDFSPSGMFVESGFLFEVGTIHNLIFRCPQGDQIFSVRAEVVRVQGARQEEKDIAAGMAYEFLEMGTTKQRRLVELSAAA